MWQAFRKGEPFGGPHQATAVRADRVRYLLLAQPAAEPGHQASLRADGVTIQGQLDLRDAVLGCVVRFYRSTFTDPILAHGLTVPSMILSDCTVPGLRADRIRVDRSLSLANSRVDGCVYLRDARIGAELDLAGARITPTGYTGAAPRHNGDRHPDSYVGVDAENAVIGGDFDGNGLTLRGGLFLNLARIDGALGLQGAQIPDGFVQAPSLIVGGVYARRGFTLAGTINLFNAVINGPIELGGAMIDNPGEISFGGWGMSVHGSIMADASSCFTGTVDLQSADIYGGLDLADARISAPGPDGALHLPRATIRGALRASGAQIDGLVTLTHTQISAGVDLSATKLGRMDANNLSTAGDMNLTRATIFGPISLRGARIEGTADLDGAKVGSANGVSIQADGLVAFELTVQCHRPAGHIDLSHARVELLCDRLTSWPAGSGRPILTGFSYQQLRNYTAVADRLEMIHDATPTAEPQPYEQLANVLRAAGRDEEARRVLREKQRREARSGRWPRRLWGAVQDLTIGYGYLPGRAASIFVALLLSGTAYFALAANCNGQDGLCPIKPTEHPTWDPFLYVLDVLLPVIDLNHEKAWDPIGIDKIVTLALLISGWVLATTIAAAAGRALNRN
ncbi:hypothetical protein EV385_1090 [Krasilnikovia cinnamomea]|uniref:Membrane-associated oxidoreductase n=1 Tax=Krasilnikovia cinnamomea TaxID=349313 RepID=A0A4Q7ZGS0_9ACTN|nr:hypothetical protein [Krasilnikovia cinnamomea]RZU49345.1 hypothetical protein EV385_1090 [Krasilnikovia cinnamomea]